MPLPSSNRPPLPTFDASPFHPRASRGRGSLRVRLGVMLQRYRAHRQLTQAQLADRAELSLKYMGEVERGEANVTIEVLERIADVLNWDPWDLFSDNPRPIAEGVYTLLLAELLATVQRLTDLARWLEALDPAQRPPVDLLPPLASAQEERAEGMSPPRPKNRSRRNLRNPAPPIDASTGAQTEPVAPASVHPDSPPAPPLDSAPGRSADDEV